MHWLAIQIANAADGEFIKWTGDGFLVWFDVPLQRDVEQKADQVLEAIWHFTFLINITQLGTLSAKRIKIRHGLTYEADALITHIKYSGEVEQIDLLGRAVVMAFRLAGIESAFPSVVADGAIAKVKGGVFSTKMYGFKKRRLTKDEILKFFKGERWRTNDIYATNSPPKGKKLTPTKMRTLVTKLKAGMGPKLRGTFVHRFSQTLLGDGPPWLKETRTEYIRFLKEDMLGSLEKLIPSMQNIFDKKTATETERKS